MEAPEIDVSRITLSQHAIDRAYERMILNQNESKDKVCKYVKKKLSNAKYIGRITANDGTDSEMFTKGSYSYMVSTDLTTIKTIIKTDRLPYNPAQDKVKCLFEKEFRKLNRSEKANIKKLNLLKLEIEAEIAELKLHIYKTKSQSVKLACKGRIAALEQSLQDSQNQIEHIKANKRQIAYALAACVD